MKIRINRTDLRKSKGKISYKDQIKGFNVSKNMAKDIDQHILATIQKQHQSNERIEKSEEKSKK